MLQIAASMLIGACVVLVLTTIIVATIIVATIIVATIIVAMIQIIANAYGMLWVVFLLLLALAAVVMVAKELRDYWRD